MYLEVIATLKQKKVLLNVGLVIMLHVFLLFQVAIAASLTFFYSLLIASPPNQCQCLPFLAFVTDILYIILAWTGWSLQHL